MKHIDSRTRRELFCLQLLALTLSLFLPGLIVAAETSTLTVSIHQVPEPVKKTIEAQVGEAKLADIEKDEQEGEVTYTVNATVKSGEKRYFTVSDDGTLLNVEVMVEETPIPVQRTIKAQV